MSKNSKVCNRKFTLKDLEYLDLIEKVSLKDTKLLLEIKPLPIYPSEPFGKCIGKEDFIPQNQITSGYKYMNPTFLMD